MSYFKLSLLLSCLMAFAGCGRKPYTAQDRIEQFNQIKLNTDVPVEVLWTENLVPRIKAENSKDLFYTLGAVQVHLRRSQLELYRKLSRGALSEMAGPMTLKIDKFLKSIDFEYAAQNSLKQMPHETLDVLNAMVAGMNDYISQSYYRSKDLRIMGIDDEPWTVLDLVRVYKFTSIDVNWTVLSQLLGFNNKDFLQQLWALKVDEKDFFEEFLKTYHEKKKEEELQLKDKKDPEDLKKNEKELIEKMSFNFPSAKVPTDHLDFMENISSVTKAGSNAFAVQGLKTKSKSAIVSNDPHLGLIIPNIWLFVILDSPEYKSMGYIIPSFPVPAIGRNMDIGWGGTNLWGLSTFPTELSEEDSKKVVEEEKHLGIRFWPDRKVKVYKLGKFPVLRAKDFPELGDKDIVFRWQGYEPSDEVQTFLKMNRAKNFTEFHQAFQSYGAPGMTFVYGDKSGNVGKVVAFSQPQVNKMKFLYSADDFTDETLNSLTLPSEFNPQRQFVVSANDYTKGLRQPLSLFQAPSDRKDRMTFLLNSKSEVTLEDVKQLHSDVFSRTAYNLKNDLVKFLRQKKWVNKLHEENFSILEAWNGNYDVDSKGALIFEVFLASWSKDVVNQFVFEDIQSKQFRDRAYNFLMKNFNYRQFLSKTLKETDFLTEERVNRYFDRLQIVLNEHKDWGHFHPMDLRHPLGHLKLFRYSYSFYDEPWPGGNETLMKAAHKLSTKSAKVSFAAQARWMTDMSSINENYLVYLGGQDGFIGSENINDLSPMWKEGRYLKVPFERDEFLKMSDSKGQ